MKRKFRVLIFSLFVGLFFTTTYSVSAQSYGFVNSPVAEPKPPSSAKAIVEEILDIVGVNTSFEVRAAKIPNAAAAVANGKKYILYNPNFMTALFKATGSNRWVPVAVLAHEVGHHLSGHTSTHTTSTPANELEADEFSGFVLRKMGANLEDAQLAIRMISSKYASATHPARGDRVEAIASGWNKADVQLAGTGRQPVRTVRTTPPASSPSTSASPVLDEQYISFDVHFTIDPENRYYVTKRNNLVRLEDNKLYIVGKLHNTDHSSFPLALKTGNMLMLVSKKGQIVTRDGKLLGQVRVHRG